jgi:hypothetical protein
VKDDHDYLSTACYHELHHACRKVCKFCDADCRCGCHGGGGEEEQPPKLAEALTTLTE